MAPAPFGDGLGPPAQAKQGREPAPGQSEHAFPRNRLDNHLAAIEPCFLDQQETALKAGQRPGSPGWGRTTQHGTLSRADGTETPLETLPGRYEAYYAAIAASIRDGAPPPVTGQEARNVMLVLEAAIRSAAERRTVAVI